MIQEGWRLGVKRAADLLLSTVGLVAFSPLLGCTAAAIRIGLGSPVLFIQMRPGRGGKPFNLVKFRTMRDAVDEQGAPLPDEQRVTKLGQLIRALSLDELPQLWNVWRGDMSLVGPRPLLMQYLSRYTPRQARRHDVMPGITGWAQVNGRNALSHEERFELDVWYVDNWSLALDARILCMTAKAVLSRVGVSNAAHVTMPEFKGTLLERASA